MKDDSSQGGPLAGLRIIDITEVVMGPAATQMLADLGADVIKVEPPGGDMLRATGPGGRAGAGPLFLNLNRNKRSIVLDLKQPAGKEALLKLAETADALVYNVRPQAMKRLGLDYEAVRQVNPRIVYVGTFGFSQRGRYAALRAFDDLIQAAVAIPEASVRAGSDVPRYAPLNLSDRATGLYAFGVICAALLARERTGRGQAVDVPMFETTAQMMLGDHLYGHTFIPPRGGFGYPRLLNPQRRPYATQDGLVCLVVYTDEQWKAFMRAVGEAERFESDPRFADGESRTQHVEALYEILADKLRTKTTQEWRELLEPLGIPVLPAHTFESLMDDPHLQDIGFFQQFEHPTEGALRTMAVPSEWPQTPLPPLRPPPLLGEHSAQVLAEAGYSPRADSTRWSQTGVTQVATGTERHGGRSMTTVVNASRQDARLVLTIDRPERRNALNAEVIGALQEALDRREGRRDDPRRGAHRRRATRRSAPAPTWARTPSRSTTRRRPSPMPTCCARPARSTCRSSRGSTAPAWPAAWACSRCAISPSPPRARSSACPRRRSASFRCRCSPCCRPRCRSAASRSCA